MPDVFQLPKYVAVQTGVQLQPPPAEILRDVTTLVENAAKELKPGERGRLAWILTTKGVNLAVVNRAVDEEQVKVDVTAWIGKTWGEPIAAGFGGAVTWR